VGSARIKKKIEDKRIAAIPKFADNVGRHNKNCRYI